MAQSPIHLDGESKDTVMPQAPPEASHSDDHPPPRTVFDEPLPSAAEVKSYNHLQLLGFLQPLLDKWPASEQDLAA